MYYALLSYGAEDEGAHGEACGGLPFEDVELSLTLLPSTAALTVLSKDRVFDGPFVNQKTQLLGLHVIEAKSLEEAIDRARSVLENEGDTMAVEIRPMEKWRVRQGS
ncbi:YciI family protein [Mesorhizobium sp. M0977]|uniref:YciI family protein n=1 Tax=Mesorhizobium sp. M0977 TaxID=2957039 RepID=UPI00333AF947